MHVGIFGKNKKEVTWEDIQSAMRAPAIPEEQAEWFKGNKRSLENSSAIANTWAAFPNSWINVETAAVFVSNRIPPVCELCEEVDTCSSCEKNESNFLSMLTANQDSDWLVWELQRTQESDIADGILVLFDPEVYSTLNPENGLRFKAQEMAPIKIGTIVVGAVALDQGTIYIADKIATQDSDFFISGTRVKSGNYQVVAWMGFNNRGELTPVALGVYGEAFAHDLNKDLKLSSDAPHDIKKLINDCEMVFARAGNNQVHYAQVNAEFYDENSPFEQFIARSWKYQLTSEGDQSDDFFTWLMEEEMTVGARLSALDSLRIRGKQSLTLSYLGKIEAKFSEDLSDRDKFTIEMMRTLPSGQLIIAN
jgi:hypothetical protein